ncbi:amino acid/amide ABC transporter ATP-binding protein 1, HAAT family [Roseomonas rosea]|uniref:Amino acid/amide ABC transporter ATP-binding protein 1, HAAT family n=1 Tax=Muricoccus roseus TaxID=198092 RepID=A0A1M6FKP7_9PROT|nr:ABC transporter ATP-binding protein [Roseomonas rosea]SHI98199.1 amino acid/amide ABC transporter ATP-binding protein 1, HAAT family [Roseomonas rosea]
MSIAISVEGLSKSFAGVQAIRNLSFAVPKGGATALIGPNGAGKTTVFNMISGVYAADAGRIVVNGTDVTAMPSRRRIRTGIARSFQNIRLMPHLTVLENLLVGQHVRASSLLDLLTPFRLVPNHRWKREARAALEESGLGRYADETVSGLPYGVRKRIDLVRATLAGADVLMLDEPAAGLNPSETHALRDHLRALLGRGLTLLVVEHDMKFVDSICDNVVVLNFGEKIAEGPLSQVRRHPKVREAYIGVEEEA